MAFTLSATTEIRRMRKHYWRCKKGPLYIYMSPGTLCANIKISTSKVDPFCVPRSEPGVSKSDVILWMHIP